MNELEPLVRAAVADLAGESEPRDLMPGVRARARRIRTVHRAGYLAATLLVVLALLVPFLLTRPVHRTEPIGPPSHAPSPTASVPAPVPHYSGPLLAVVRLPGGWVVTGASHLWSVDTASSGSWVLDRRTMRYQHLTYPNALPAPGGTTVLVGSAGGTGYALLDLATNQVHQLHVPVGYGDPKWSPDGHRIVLSRAPGSFAVVDAADATVSVHPVDTNRYRCNDNCDLTWYPDSRSVVLAQTDPTVAHNEAWPDVQRGLQLFDADSGTPGELLPVHGIVYGERSWSPDGTRVLVEGTVTVGSGRGRAAQVVEVATGRVVTTMTGLVQPWLGGWIDSGHIFGVSGTGLCSLDVSTSGRIRDCTSPSIDIDQGLELLVGPG